MGCQGLVQDVGMLGLILHLATDSLGDLGQVMLSIPGGEADGGWLFPPLLCLLYLSGLQVTWVRSVSPCVHLTLFLAGRDKHGQNVGNRRGQSCIASRQGDAGIARSSIPASP